MLMVGGVALQLFFGVVMSLTQTVTDTTCLCSADYFEIKTKSGEEILIVNLCKLPQDDSLKRRLFGFILVSTKKEYGVFMKEKKVKCWRCSWWWIVVILSVFFTCSIVINSIPDIYSHI